MRKLEGAALKKTMAQLKNMKKGKNGEVVKAKGKGAPPKKSGILRKMKKSPVTNKVKRGVTDEMEHVSVNGIADSNPQMNCIPSAKEEGNGGVKFMEDETDPYCPDFDDEPALLPLIGRKRKPVLNNFDNSLASDIMPTSENASMNGDIKENLGGRNNLASTSILTTEQLPNGEGGNDLNSTPKKPKKTKLKGNQTNSPEDSSGSTKAKKKRKESIESSADNAEHSPPKKKKKEKTMVNCEKCSKEFSSEKLYIRHLKICNLNEEELNRLQPHKCSECDYRSPKKAMVTRHLESHGIYKCVKCNFIGDSKEAFREHTLEAHKDRADMKLCRVCSRYVKCDVITLEQHMSECKGKVPLFCPECKKEFKYESSLNVHLNSHYPDRPKRFSCQQCDYKSNYKANLQKHITCMHENRVRSVKCDLCDKLFYSDEAMKRHAKLHADDRPYICSVCGHGCRTLSAYKTHQEEHKPNNSFLCTINDCPDGFRTAQLLKKHEETIHHVSPKRFHCREKGCKLSFCKRSHLRRHETTHTGERKYRCEWEGCGKAFRHADNLKVHMRQHTNENPVKCELCSFTCKQKSSLKWHMGKQHPDDDKKKKVLIDCPQDDWAFWEAVMAVIGPDGTGLDEETIGQPPVSLKESKVSSKKKGTLNSKKKKSSGEGKKKVSKGKTGSSKKKKKVAVTEKLEDNADKDDDAVAKPESAEDNTTEGKSVPKEKKKKGAKRKSPRTTAKSKGKKTNKSKEKTEEISEDGKVEDNVATTPKKKQKKSVDVKNSPKENVCEIEGDSVEIVSQPSVVGKGKKAPKGKKLGKSKACKVAKRKGKTSLRKTRGKKGLLKSTKKSTKASLKKKAPVVEEVKENLEEDVPKDEPLPKKRKRGKVEDQSDLVVVKPKKAKKSPAKGRKVSKTKKQTAKSKKKTAKSKQKKSPSKTKAVEEEEEVKQEEPEVVLPAETEEPEQPEQQCDDEDVEEKIEKEPPKEEQPTEELDSDSDLWGNNDDNNTEEPDRNCDADDERDLDNDDDVDKFSEAGFLGDIDKTFSGAVEKRCVDEDARSRVSDANNSISDVASLDDAIPDTPPRAPMRPNDNEEEVDENDYYQPPPSPPPHMDTLESVDQHSIERQDSEQTVIDNSLPHSNNTCTPQDVLSEEAVVKDSMTQPDATPTYVHTPQSQQPEAPPPHPDDKDYFGQYLQDLPTVEGQAAPPAPTQDSSPGQVPEDLTNIQIPSGNVEGTNDEIKALDLRPEPVSTITHTRLQRETVTGLASSNIERETVSTITHTSRTVQPIVTQPSCIPVPGMQTDVMSYQRMELLACGRPDNFMQQKESSLQRLTSITYQNFGNLDSVNPTCRDMNYLRPSENMFPRSCAGGSFMRVTDGESSLGRAGMNSFLRQPDTSFVRPETSLTRAANPSLLRPGTEDLFARDAMGRPVSRSPFHGAWTGQEIRPAHWNQNPYLQRPVDRTTNSATPALLGTERDFAFDPGRSIPDQNVFSNLTSQQHELPRDTPFQLERFDLSSYFGTHPYSATPALEYGHPTCGANQKAFEDRLRQPSAVPDLRGLPQPSSTDMLNQFCGINVNPSFNLDKYMYARDPVYRPQHVTGTSESAFLSHTAPTQPTYFSRDYTGRTLYPQSNPYALMDDRQYGTASKLTHPAGVQQDRDLMGRRSTTNDNQIQDPYRRSVIYNVMNRF